MTTILALDIATNLGFAFGSDSAEAPTFGSVKFGADEASNAARFAACLRWCVNEFKSHPPDILAIEATMKAFRKNNKQSTTFTFGYHAIVKAVAFECGIHDIQEHDVSDVRNIFIGYSRLTRDVAKAAAVKRCHQLGWNVTDGDQGDACAVWMYQCAMINKRKVFDRLATCGIITITEPKKSIGPKLSKKLLRRSHLTT
jgi:hypothetical protein